MFACFVCSSWFVVCVLQVFDYRSLVLFVVCRLLFCSLCVVCLCCSWLCVLLLLMFDARRFLVVYCLVLFSDVCGLLLLAFVVVRCGLLLYVVCCLLFDV